MHAALECQQYKQYELGYHLFYSQLCPRKESLSSNETPINLYWHLDICVDKHSSRTRTGKESEDPLETRPLLSSEGTIFIQPVGGSKQAGTFSQRCFPTWALAHGSPPDRDFFDPPVDCLPLSFQRFLFILFHFTPT